MSQIVIFGCCELELCWVCSMIDNGYGFQVLLFLVLKWGVMIVGLKSGVSGDGFGFMIVQCFVRRYGGSVQIELVLSGGC